MINFFWFSPGVAYTSECFHCKPGTHSANPGSARCTPCPADTYSNKGATTCHECEGDKYAGMPVCLSLSRWSKAFLQTYNCYVPHTCKCSSYCLVVKLILSLDLNVCCAFFLIQKHFQSSVQRAANRDLHVQAVTTSTPTPSVTLRER